jgi:chromosome segregation ATPase
MIANEVMHAVLELVQRKLDELYDRHEIDTYDRVSLESIRWTSYAMSNELAVAETAIITLREELQQSQANLQSVSANCASLSRELDSEKKAYQTFRTSQNGMMNELQEVTVERNRLREELQQLKGGEQ